MMLKSAEFHVTLDKLLSVPGSIEPVSRPFGSQLEELTLQHCTGTMVHIIKNVANRTNLSVLSRTLGTGKNI